jgi:hypothetical protein
MSLEMQLVLSIWLAKLRKCRSVNDNKETKR